MFPPEAETMLPCPACRGAKSLLREDAAGRYRMKPCRWCGSTGAVNLKTIRKFFRWRRIMARNAWRCRFKPDP